MLEGIKMYEAIICRVYTRPHPNADRLLLGNARGYQVIVGKETVDGELGILFPPEGQLDREYLLANGYYRRHPETGESMGGFFEHNGRVKTTKLRGERSEAFWAPLESLYYIDGLVRGGIDGQSERGTTEILFDSKRGFEYADGYALTELKKHKLCQKYETPATKAARANRESSKSKRANVHFRKHFDTPQLKREVHRIPVGATLHFTEKVHGTSQRTGWVISDEKPSFLHRIGEWIAGTRLERVYETLLGTRNVILGDAEGSGTKSGVDSYYGKEGFRYRHHDHLKNRLKKGETVYYEVVGYTETGGPIMPGASTEELRGHKVGHSSPRKAGKPIEEVYGDRIEYTYDCDPGDSKVFVYRITQQNADGIELDLSWDQVKGRCAELGVNPVPEVFSMKRNFAEGDPPHSQYSDPDDDPLKQHRDQLVATVERWASGASLVDPSHIREGICVRWEHFGNVGILKLKSFEFLTLEGVIKTDDSYVDMEEVA